MGRLFWKFFFAIWLAQVVAAFGISGGIWVKDRDRARRIEAIDTSPPAATMLDAAAATLQFGGMPALRGLLAQMDRHQVFVVGPDNRDILGRKINPVTVEQARRLLEQNGRQRTLREAAAADGITYLLFVPRVERGDRSWPSASPGPRPPPHGGPHFPFMPMLLAMLASLVSAALLAWHFSKPIRTLRTAFDAASTGKLDTRVGPAMGKRRDELADLGRDFDRMASQLHVLMDGQRRLLHDVSHELRSPLARLQAAIGLARQRPDRIEASLERIERESVRIDELVGELLTLSRLEAGVIGSLDEEVNISELVADIADDARFEAQAAGKDVRLADSTLAVVHGNTELLHRAIENVVRNALRHTAAATVVDIAISTTNGNVTIAIRDHGPGVPEDEKEAIFAPFFRGSRAVGKNDGHGLGLAIAKRTIEAHGGNISASNLAEGGLCVEIFLPNHARQ